MTLVAVLAVLYLGAAADPGRAMPAGSVDVVYGVAEPAGSLPGAETKADAAAWSAIRSDVAGSGACWLRSDLDSWLTGAIEAYDWLGSPAPCTASAGTPVKVLAILDAQTVWSARHLCPDAPFSGPFLAHRRDFTPDDWRLLVRCLARQFAGRISAYEIWNEPLLAYSMFGYQDGTTAHYAELLQIAYTEIKAADPGATVIALGGSDLYAAGDAERMARMRSFTTELVALGAPRYADALSVHAYPWGRTDDAVWSSYLAELRFQAGAWAKPVWITETGWRVTDPGTQTGYMDTAYPLIVGAGVRHIFWFSITDQPDGSFGLRDRPIERALRTFALSHLTAGAPVSPGQPGT